MKKFLWAICAFVVGLAIYAEYRFVHQPKPLLIINGKEILPSDFETKKKQFGLSDSAVAIEKIIDEEVVSYEARRLHQTPEDLLAFFKNLNPELREKAGRTYIQELRRRSTIKRFNL